MLIRWTPAATADFQGISYHLERERNLETANRVCRRIYDAIQSLRRMPQMGRPGLWQGTRELTQPPYVIVYRLHEDAVEVLHIWHGAQDWR